MAQLFEKALIVLIAIIVTSTTLSGIQYVTKEVEARIVAGTCEALASKLFETSYMAITMGKAELVINSPVEVTLTFMDEGLTVSSYGYVAKRNLPLRATGFSKTFSGRCRIIFEVRNGILWIGEA